MSKKKEEDKKPKVHDDLKGMNVEINSFGEITSNIDIDKINDFLNKHVEDKKLLKRDGDTKEGGKPSTS